MQLPLRAFALLAVLVAVLLVSACASTDGATRHAHAGLVTLRGEPVTLEGDDVRVGEPAPDFVAVGADMRDVRLSDWAGRTVVLATVPSIETRVSDLGTRTFDERAAALGDDVVVLTVSMDLPMAQSRWCGAQGVDRVVMLSDYKYRSVSDLYGVRVRETGLLARAVFVIDPAGVLRYARITSELSNEPDYEAALDAAAAASRR